MMRGVNVARYGRASGVESPTPGPQPSEPAPPPARKLLIVSYHFPPDSRVGAVRPAKFAKCLTRFGWQPYVLTIRTRHIPAPDEDRLRDVRDVPTVRTAVWPTVTDLVLRARTRLARLVTRTRVAPASAGAGPDATEPPAARAAAARPSWRLAARRALCFIFEFPDNEVGWVLPAVWRGYRLIRQERIDVVMVSSPPRSSVFIGLALARLTGARLITDLRDPWFSGEAGGSGRVRHADRFRAWVERQLIERSDEVISTTDRYTAFLRRQYPSVDAGRFHTITNGYDADDFDDIEAVPADDSAFTLSYLGTFYWTRTPAPLFAALAGLVGDGTIPRGRLRVNLIGTVRHADGVPVTDLVRAHGLEGAVTIRGVIPYRQALAEMKKASVLVLIAPDAQAFGIPAKTFEYIAVGRPILCLGDQGATADLIRRTECGVVVNPADVRDVRRAIEALYRAWQSGESRTLAVDRTEFERRRLARSLADILG
jgi:glycosyltransferase involved in cell wall biosynthesis